MARTEESREMLKDVVIEPWCCAHHPNVEATMTHVVSRGLQTNQR